MDCQVVAEDSGAVFVDQVTSWCLESGCEGYRLCVLRVAREGESVAWFT